MEMEPIKESDEPEITPDTALTVLVDILDKTALWQKDPNIKICCKMIGAKIIDLQTRIDNGIAALNNSVQP